MKTSNKLLLALIIFIFFLATLTVGIAKYYHNTVVNQAQSEMNEASTASFSMEENRDSFRVPSVFILLPQLQW